MVAYEIPGEAFTLIAAADLSAFQYCGVKVDSSGLAAAPAVGGPIIGVCQNKPGSGKAATIVADGIVIAKAQAAIAAGAFVSIGATDGRFKTAVSTNTVLGQALTAAGAANEYFALRLTLGQNVMA